MGFALEFHDSEVRDAVADGNTVRVRLSAAAVRSDAGERGWLPGVALTLADATLAGDTAHAFGKLAEGRLRQDGRDIAALAVPVTLAGRIELTLRFANGTQLSARGRSLALSVADDARFAEDLSC
jgi:hypothetical protein